MPTPANDAPLEVACPQCSKPVVWSPESAYRPFCSKRCQLLDLGAWAEESHRISGESAMDEAIWTRCLPKRIETPRSLSP